MLAFIGFAVLAFLEKLQLPTISSSNRTITSYILGGEETFAGEYPYFGKLEIARIVETNSNAYIVVMKSNAYIIDPNLIVFDDPQCKHKPVEVPL